MLRGENTVGSGEGSQGRDGGGEVWMGPWGRTSQDAWGHNGPLSHAGLQAP